MLKKMGKYMPQGSGIMMIGTFFNVWLSANCQISKINLYCFVTVKINIIFLIS